jgi:hypothetical protein
MLHNVGRLGNKSRHDDLAVGQTNVFPDLILVVVARIGRLEAVGLGIQLEHRRRDLAQRDVLRVRAVAATAAPVRAHSLLRNALKRVVHDLNAQLHLADDVVAGEIQHGILGRPIELQDEAGVGDRLVLFVQCVGQRIQVGAVAQVVLQDVAILAFRCWRYGSHERLGHVQAFERLAQRVEVAA